MLYSRLRFVSSFSSTTLLATSHRYFNSLPVIDVGALVDPGATLDAKKKVGEQLHDACQRVGFFYVKNHGVSPSIYEGVLSEARAWFHLQEHVKEQIRISPAKHYRGWQHLGANVTRYEGGFQRDWHEGIDFYKEEDPLQLQARGIPPSPIHGPNQWPHQLPSFERALKTYINSMQNVGSALMSGIALGLGLPQEFFAGDKAGKEDSYWCVRVIYYPPLATSSTDKNDVITSNDGSSSSSSSSMQSSCSDSAAQQEQHEAVASGAVHGAEVARSVQLSCGEHTDYGLLTLVNQETKVTALQVKNAAGQWINATPIPGTFVCNIGDMLKVWTNGMYTPTLHRVVNAHPTSDRVSIPFFYEPCFETKVAPLEPLLSRTGSSPKFPPVRYGSHLESKVLNNFEL